jgi:hypothetical protein
MLAFLKSAFSWFVDVLPDLSYLILALVGIVLALKKIEGISRWVIVTVCLVVGGAGFGVGVYKERHATQQMSTLVGNTNDLVTETKSVLTMVGSLLPQIAAANQGVADLKSELGAAEAKNDPRLVASLQAKLAEAQNKADDLSRELADAAKKFNPPVVPGPTAATPPPAAISSFPANPDSQALQREAFGLVSQINDWVASVSQTAPNVSSYLNPFSSPPSDVEKARKYSEQLDSEWQSTFQIEAVSMIGKLHIPGIFHLACRATQFNSDTDFSARLRRYKDCATMLDQGAKNLKE